MQGPRIFRQTSLQCAPFGQTIARINETLQAYTDRLSQAAQLERELEVARLVLGLTKYPDEKVRAIPVQAVIPLLTPVLNYCIVKGINPDIFDRVFRAMKPSARAKGWRMTYWQGERFRR